MNIKEEIFLEKNLRDNMHKFSDYPVYLNILIGPDNRTFISLSTGGIKDLISVISDSKLEALKDITIKMAIKTYFKKIK